MKEVSQLPWGYSKERTPRINATLVPHHSTLGDDLAITYISYDHKFSRTVDYLTCSINFTFAYRYLLLSVSFSPVLMRFP